MKMDGIVIIEKLNRPLNTVFAHAAGSILLLKTDQPPNARPAYARLLPAILRASTQSGRRVPRPTARSPRSVRDLLFGRRRSITAISGPLLRLQPRPRVVTRDGRQQVREPTPRNSMALPTSMTAIAMGAGGLEMLVPKRPACARRWRNRSRSRAGVNRPTSCSAGSTQRQGAALGPKSPATFRFGQASALEAGTVMAL